MHALFVRRHNFGPSVPIQVCDGELRADALASLEVFGARALRLRELADFIVLRKF